MQEQLQSSIDALQYDIDFYETNPEVAISERISQLQSSVDSCTYYETPEGKRCMKEHLEFLLLGFEHDPQKALTREISKKKSKIESLEAEIDGL